MAVASPGAHTARARAELLLPAWAGIVGPVLFTAAFLVHEALRADDYSPIAEPVSALEAGPNGWVQQVNFVVLGLLTIAFAVGLWYAVRRGWAARLGAVIIGLSGFGALLAARAPRSRGSSDR